MTEEEKMKRSEMLCAIDKRFPTLHMECNLEELLAFLEEQGMQPPPYKAKALIGFYEVQDWEPEITQETIDQALEHIGRKGVRGEMEITE